VTRSLPSLSKASRRILIVATLVALVPFLLWSRLEADVHRRSTLHVEDIQYIPAPRSLPILSLGYRRALADLFWVATLVYFGEQVALRGRMKYLAARTDAILALDPRFREVYKWIGVVAVYNTGSITFGDIETSNRYLERGMRAFPRDGELVYLLAFNYAIEMPPFVEDPARKGELRRKAAELFDRAARLPGAPADAALMAAEMTTRSADRSVLIARLRSLLAIATEDRIRDQLVARLAQVTSEAEAEAEDADRRELQEAWRRDYPFLPRGMFVLVGPKLGPAAAP
jgi:hypothetical protein